MSAAVGSAVLRVVALPVTDYLAALSTCLQPLGPGRLVALVSAFILSWWLYVPVHEIAHAYGCILTGGEVTRLEIDPLYGAAWLANVFPFVAVGSEYAGQLTGFDTRGSDFVYLATDFLPFLLTIFLGVPLLRSSAREHGRGLRACAKLGAALPVAYAPFISLTGDYYEMGSILVSRVVSRAAPAFPLERWRSDDLLKLAGQLYSGGGDGTSFDLLGLAVSAALGAVLAFATYGLGAATSSALQGRAPWRFACGRGERQ